MSYWDETEQYLNRHGGDGPTCPNCGRVMFPADDHGRFVCFCDLGNPFDTVLGVSRRAPRIRQVDTARMSNAEKAGIPPINRLDSTPTAAEVQLLSLLASGPDAMDSPAYQEAMAAIERERGK